MEILYRWIDGINDVLWSYLLVALLLGCAVWFTLRTRGVQFRMLGEMVRVLGESAGSGPKGERHVSSFQAFAVSLASRVGTGNLAGVATAIVVGGPGAVFWMWVIALVGAASAFVESTLAQLYKRRGRDSFIGGPAYYMERGLGRRWMGVLFAVLISVTFGFAFNSVQSNTICAAWEGAFGFDHHWVGIALTLLTLGVIFGGIHRIARVSGVVVPVMALGYIVLALGVVLFNFRRLPEVVELIVANAFGWEQAMGGGAGAALMQGIRRGLFSNEAGMGSAPNAAATADVSHPAKQGLVQMLSVFIDTLLICSATAFMCLCSGVVPTKEAAGAAYVQASMQQALGSFGPIFIAVSMSLFAFTTLIGNYYYCEGCLKYILRRDPSKAGMTVFRLAATALVFVGAIVSAGLAWDTADMLQGTMVIINIPVILILGNKGLAVLKDYMRQRKEGKNPEFHAADIGITGTDYWN